MAPAGRSGAPGWPDRPNVGQHPAVVLLVVDPADPDPGPIARAAAVLRGGGLVAFPTETVYGLGGDALDPGAVARIFAVKGRPADDPLIVHVADMAGLAEVAGHLPDRVAGLAARFWPGPLTLVVPRSGAVPAAVSGGRPTVAVRVPAHPVALALLRAAGRPVAAPSANRFGRISPTSAGDVVAELGDAVEMILDGGATSVGVESTVLDMCAEMPVILRPGAVTLEQLRAVLGRVEVAGRHEPAAGAAPGRYLRHYAPTTPLVLLERTEPAALAALAETLATAGLSVGVLLLGGDRPPAGVPTVALGPADRPGEVAATLYAALRRADRLGVSVLVARILDEAGIGRAVNDRLHRAAAGRTVVGADPTSVDVVAGLAAGRPD